jgi:hypothetical protein
MLRWYGGVARRGGARGGAGAEFFRSGGDNREGREWRARVRGEVSAQPSHLGMCSRRGGMGGHGCHTVAGF